MNKKNNAVATAQESKTTIENIENTTAKKDNTPTGKVKNLAERKKIREEREIAYQNFRINALKRRAKRMGLSEEQTNVKIEELKKQLASSDSYTVLIIFDKNNIDLVKQALKKEDIQYNIIADYYAFMDADKELLGTLREILPTGTKIHPYVKKKPPILPMVAKSKEKTKRLGPKKIRSANKAVKEGIYIAKNNDKSNTPKAIRNAKKAERIRIHRSKKTGEIEHRTMSARPNRHTRPNKVARRMMKAVKLAQKRAQNALKKANGTTIHMKPKKPSNASKKASTTIKKAA